MPYVKYKRASSSRRYKLRSTRPKKVSLRKRAWKAPSGMPYKRYVRMRYSTQIVVGSSLGAKAEYAFHCNSIFDPDVTGIGHQPLGHDEWANLYDKYRVVRSKITVQSVNSSTPSSIITLLKTDDLTGTAGSCSADIEQGRTTWRVQGNTAAQQAVTLKSSFNVKREFPNLDKDDTLTGTFGANPGEGKYWIVALQAVDSASTVSSPMLVTIDYYVELTVPKILTQS